MERKKRSVTLTHDQSPESEAAILALQTRRHLEEIRVVDITGCTWDEPLAYKVPYIVTPEGTFQGLGGVQEYLSRPKEFRR